MEFRPDGSVLAQTALSMSRLSHEELSGDAAETTRLVRLTLGGDSAAFEQIILRYQTRVMNLAARFLGTRDDARDVAQEVFLRAFKYLHRLDVQKPLEPWLMRITVNVCRDAARSRQRRRDTFLEIETPETIDQSADPYAGLARKQERVMLQRALASLPAKERLAIVLRDVEGRSTSEVASILQSSETTVRSQVSRGRLRLKTAIDRLTGGEP
jgi:RNA polymerase sigma factor (sigma-70 family)